MHSQDKDAARYRQVRRMLIEERLSKFCRTYQWPSGSDKVVSQAEFDAAIDMAIEQDRKILEVA